MALAEVVQLRDSPSLRDIPASLRHLADCIEQGEHGDITALAVVAPVKDTWPIMFHLGDIDDLYEWIGLFEHAKALMLREAS